MGVGSFVSGCIVAQALGLAACGDYESAAPATPDNGLATDTGTATDGVTTAGTTWHEHVRPLVERTCNACHSPGGIAPMAFDSWAAVEPWKTAMVARVLDPDPLKRMPPWSMDPACRDIQDARLLTAAEKQVFTDWRSDGFAEGDPAKYVAPPAPPSSSLGEPGLVLTRTDAYSPSTLVIDDYRCFLYPQQVTEDVWVRAVDIVPDKREVVHHVLLFIVPPGEVSKLTALDQETATVPGYPCVGGSGASGDTLLSGWVPGMQPVIYPDGAAYFVPKGSRFVMQMHYNTANVADRPPAPADATSAKLWTLPARSYQPEREVRLRAILDHDLDITKGASSVIEGQSVKSPYSETVIGVIPHMHLLGKRLKVAAQPLGSASEVCLADIPKWDFNYQQTYQFEPTDEVKVRFGDRVRIECEYDNSKGTSDVHWGEGTNDEMCLAYLVTTTPRYDDGSDTLCDGFTQCMQDCPAADTLCPVDCLAWTPGGGQCLSCGIEPIYSTCAQAECATSGLLLPLAACLASCGTPGDQLGCALGECRAQLDALYGGCLEVALKSGKCNDEAAACGIGPVVE